MIKLQLSIMDGGRTYPAVIKTYCWLCTGESLLLGLTGLIPDQPPAKYIHPALLSMQSPKSTFKQLVWKI